MKSVFTLLPLWLLACVACAVNSIEREFLCPVCGTHWEQRIETAGRSRGLRLDLRQLGDVVDPPTLPQCSKCRFPLFSDRLAAQSGDPAKAKSFKRLRTFVLGADFQMLAAKNPPYFMLAQVQELLGAPHRAVALSYLRASWQAEDRDAVSRRFLEKAHTHYVAALAETGAQDGRRGDLMLLSGEIERRLEMWDAAGKRFRELEVSGILKGTPQAGIPAIQFRLIEEHDSEPHPIEGAFTVEKRPSKPGDTPDGRPALRLDDLGRIENQSEPALKLAEPPKPPADVPAPALPERKK